MKRLLSQSQQVAMGGDGINEAPVIAVQRQVFPREYQEQTSPWR